jgi:hypothetical protein
MEQTAVEWLYNNLLLNPISNEDIEYNEAVFENAKVLDAQQERSYSEKESFENKSLKWWMSLTMDEQVEIGFKYDMPTFNLTLRAIMHEFEQFKKK